MTTEIRDVIHMIADTLKKYESAYGEELFPADKSTSLSEMFFFDLIAFSFALGTLEGPISNDRIRLINYHLGTEYPINNGWDFYTKMEAMRKECAENVPFVIKAIVSIENYLYNDTAFISSPILNTVISAFDYYVQEFVVYNCSSEADLSIDEVQYAGKYLDRIREYARDNYFSPDLIENSTVYSAIETPKERSDYAVSIFATTLTAGDGYSVGIKNDGTAIAVGENGGEECEVFEWSNLISVSAGMMHSVALMSNGKCVATGENSSGECNVSEWEDIMLVSAGFKFTVALNSKGNLFAVGKNCDAIMHAFRGEKLVGVSAGNHHVIGLRSNGTVIAYGENIHGECNVDLWSDIVAISAGYEHTLGLKKDGTVIATGLKKYNRCEVWSWSDIVSISAGAWHSVGLRKDGTVLIAGMSKYERQETGRWSNVVAIAAGAEFTLGLRNDGTVLACGENDCDQCDASEWGDIRLPSPIKC